MLTYSHLVRLQTFEARLEYLKLCGVVGKETFGSSRFLNQILYRSTEWRNLRKYIITRDDGCDLAMPGYDIYDKILIHHLNPITEEDVDERRDCVFDPENLVCISFDTHNYIHFGRIRKTHQCPIERHLGDTKLW